MLIVEPPGVDWTQFGAVGALVGGWLWLGWRGVWLWRRDHEEILRRVEAERDRALAGELEWKTIALTQAGILERTVEKTTEIVHRVASAHHEEEDPTP